MKAVPDMQADPALGATIYALAAELYPICRSLAGPGVRQTLDILDREIGLTRTEVPSGTPALDWSTPREWSVREAWIKDPDGRIVLDFADCNLHVVNYSTSVHRHLPLDELRGHIFTLPDAPDRIPYRTSYYADHWGFCMRHDEFERLGDGNYEVHIDAEHRNGHMSYGEHVIRGWTQREFLLSAHICHPSLANDNCSGLAVLAQLAKTLAGRDVRHTYRFLFAPGSIGALTWLSRNEEGVGRIDHGLVVSCVGDGGGPTYKCSRRGDAEIDRAMRQVLRDAGPGASIRDFVPYGYDERQYCSPGYDLPVGLFQRSAFGTFPEYHTSADNLDFIAPEHLAASHDMILEAILIIEEDWTPVNLSPRGEPQLGRRGLYGSIGGGSNAPDTMALLWVLNLADGWHSLLDIAERSGLAFRAVAAAARRLSEAGLLADADTVRRKTQRARRRALLSKAGHRQGEGVA
jgi:aminopeptidase-like protein